MASSEYMIGVDLGQESVQLAYAAGEDSELSSLELDGQGLIPALMYRSGGEWLIGSNALTRAREEGTEPVRLMTDEDLPEPRAGLLSMFIRKLIAAALPGEDAGVRYLALTYEEADDELLKSMEEAASVICPDHCVIGRLLCSEFYAFSQRMELWNRDVGIFQYDRKGLRYTHLDISTGHHPAVVSAGSSDLSSFLDGASLDLDDLDARDEKFASAVRKISEGRTISSFYLTGPGFDDAGQGVSWMKKSLAALCAGRRHVFVGQNLFARGACYAGICSVYPERKPDFAPLGTELTIHQIYLAVQEGKREAALVLIPAQMLRSQAGGSASVILDGADELTICAADTAGGGIRSFFMKLDSLPDRPDKTVRLNVEAAFTGDGRLHIRASDTGFGDFFPSSGRCWEEDIDMSVQDTGRAKPEGRVLAAAPYGQPGLEISLSGKHVCSTDELCWFIYDNIYMVPEDMFSPAALGWLEKKGRADLSARLKDMTRSGAPLKEQIRAFLAGTAYLDSRQISSVYSALEQLEEHSPLERTKLKADSLCRYGSCLEALRLYHHALCLMEKTEDGSRQERALVLHNMAVCLMYLHDTDSAADCMYRAWKTDKGRRFLAEYLCILRIGGRDEEIRKLAVTGDVSPQMLDETSVMCRNAARSYSQSERYLGLKAGLALKNVPGSPVYSEFVEGYIKAQGRRYGLYSPSKDGDPHKQEAINERQGKGPSPSTGEKYL